MMRLPSKGISPLVRRARPAGDQDMFAAQRDLVDFAVHLDRMRVGELRQPLKNRNAVAAQLRPDHVRFARDDARHAGGQIVDRNVSFAAVVVAVKRPHRDSGELENRFADAFARYRAGVHAHAAHHDRAVNDRHALAQLRRANRALLARGAAADDNQIVGLVVHAKKAALL